MCSTYRVTQPEDVPQTFRGGDDDDKEAENRRNRMANAVSYSYYGVSFYGGN
jgi:hypothetical protein